MNAMASASSAPPNALKFWCDARSIYVELPNKLTGLPYTISFHRNSAGLAQALHLLYGSADVSGTPYTPSTKSRPLVSSPAHHAAAAALLSRRKLL
jgi:hypothetical protein